MYVNKNSNSLPQSMKQAVMGDKQSIIGEWHFITIYGLPSPLVFPSDGAMRTGCSLMRNVQMSLKEKKDIVMAFCGGRRREEKGEATDRGNEKKSSVENNIDHSPLSARPSPSLGPSVPLTEIH